MKILIYDCTLRDGSQGENISFSVQDKLRIARQLDSFGVHYIEGGWPGSNPKDAAFFTQATALSWKSKIAAFGSTRYWKNRVDEDANLLALLEAQTPVVTLVGKSWDFHVSRALGIPLDQNLEIIRESIEYLKDKGKEVIFDAEHFFDGYRDNPGYTRQVLEAARDAGADWIVLCDTNGGSLPSWISSVVSGLREEFPRLGIHTHNDSELAVANSLAAVQEGAGMVQGTINGYGERVGNASLTSIIPNLELKMGLQSVGKDNLRGLSSLAHFVSETANLAVPNNLPFVGQSAFAHKGGIHVNAVLKDSKTYEHIDPGSVGNDRRVLVSDLSGRSNLLYKVQESGELDLGKKDLKLLLERVKQLEFEGYQFEGAEASFKLLARRASESFAPPFEVIGFRVVVDQVASGRFYSEATVRVSVNGVEEHTASDGNGPVHALDRAVKKALVRFFPELESVALTDYKVRVLDARQGTASSVRVLVQSTDGSQSWGTVGVSTNVIEASWLAIIDSLLYKLVFRQDSRVKKEILPARR